MQLDRQWIAQHIPQQGSMCLLDEVLRWDDLSISCRSSTHHGRDNPLRAHDQLSAVCGIEYAAQSMAAHGALLSAVSSKAGYLASVRSVNLHVQRLDDIAADLEIACECISANPNTVMYEFAVKAAGRLLLDGRATVILNAAVFAADSMKAQI